MIAMMATSLAIVLRGGMATLDSRREVFINSFVRARLTRRPSTIGLYLIRSTSQSMVFRRNTLNPIITATVTKERTMITLLFTKSPMKRFFAV